MCRRSILCVLTPLLLACSLTPIELRGAQQPSPDVFDANAAMAEIIVAVTELAEANAKAKTPLKGDALTEQLLRLAATKAAALPEKEQAEVFLTAVSIALDDSDALFKIPFLGELNRRRVEQFESPELRKRRVAVISAATMRDRRDLCQHFMVSISLCQFQGPAAANAAGLAKEQLDAAGESGFSFVDLQADFAGIEFWRRLRSGDLKVAALAKSVRIADVLPSSEGLKEGLSARALKETLGAKPEEALERQLQGLRNRVKQLYQDERRQQN